MNTKCIKAKFFNLRHLHFIPDKNTNNGPNSGNVESLQLQHTVKYSKHVVHSKYIFSF